ncbi:MAG: LptF/LptG family permease [Planctomycetota bacterium]
MRLYRLPKVDGYVARAAAGMLLSSAVSLCFLLAVVHAFQRMDEFRGFARESGFSLLATVWLVIKYYLCLTPQYFIEYMVPLVSVLAGVLVVSSLSAHREFTALRASGVPLRRVVAPTLATVLLLGVGIFLARDAVLPGLAREAHAISLLLDPQGSGQEVTLVLEDERGRTIRTYMMGHFDSDKEMAHNFRLEIRDVRAVAEGRANEYELFTDRDPTLGDRVWRQGYDPAHYRRGAGGLASLPRIDIPTRVTPAMLEQEALGPAVMTSTELAALSTDTGLQAELAQRRAAPVAGTVILLVGLALVLRRERTDPGSSVGRVMNVIYAILVCAAYYLVQHLFLGLAESARLGPNLAAWMPNALFGAWGGYHFWKLDL